MAINMMDLVQKNGDNINIQKLSEACGCPVYEISALKGTGIKEASDAVVKAAQAKAVQDTVHKFNSKVEGYLNEIEIHFSVLMLRMLRRDSMQLNYLNVMTRLQLR